MITADNITDAQIRELRDRTTSESLLRVCDMALNEGKPLSRYEARRSVAEALTEMQAPLAELSREQLVDLRAWAKTVIRDCDIAIRNVDGRSTSALKPEVLIRARARCAEILAARAKETR